MNSSSSRYSGTPLVFLFYTILCQLIGFGASIGLGTTIFRAEEDAGTNVLLLFVLLHSGVAFALARWLSLSKPWQILNLVLPWAIVTCLRFSIPPQLMLVALVIIVLIYVPTFWTRVPYYPTSQPMYEAILTQLPSDRPFRFLDMGCGFGSMLAYLSAERPQGQFVGVEIGPLPYAIAKLRFMLTPKRKVSIALKDFWKMSLADYDYVYTFLAPGPMEKIWEKVRAEMKKGSVYLNNSFPAHDKPDLVIEVDDDKKARLFIHRL